MLSVQLLIVSFVLYKLIMNSLVRDTRILDSTLVDNELKNRYNNLDVPCIYAIAMMTYRRHHSFPTQTSHTLLAKLPDYSTNP